MRNALCSAPFGADFSPRVSVPSSSGRPTDVGVSRRKTTRPTAPAKAIAEGIQKHHFHAPTWSGPLPSDPMIYPQRMTTSPAPIECEVFHTDIFVANCTGGIQWVSSRAQGGKPVPCNRPFTTHMTPMKRIIVLVKRSPVCSPVIQ